MTGITRARVVRIVAAGVFVAGTSLAVAGIAAAEGPDTCADGSRDQGCTPTGPPTGQSTDHPKKLIDLPSVLPTLLPGLPRPGAGEPTATSSATTAPATSASSTAGSTSAAPTASPAGTAGTAPTETGSPAATTPTGGTGSATATARGCDVRRSGGVLDVDCPSTAPDKAAADSRANGGSGPQRNYGGATPVAPAAAEPTQAAAQSTVAPGSTPGAGTGTASPHASAAVTGGQELAKTGRGANTAFLLIGGVGMTAGGFGFTLLPKRLERRRPAAAA